MATPRVTLGGITLGGASAYDWEFRSGTRPVERLYTVSQHRAKAFDPIMGQPLQLVIESDSTQLTVDDVYVIEVLPGSHPFERRLRVVDKRWLWPKQWVSTSMNRRRTLGSKFLAGGLGNQAIENQILQPDIEYAPYTLYPPDSLDPTINGVPWTPREALLWVLEEVLGETVIFKNDIPEEVEIENLVLEDNAADALERVLAYIPGMALFVDEVGKIAVYDTRSGDELGVLSSLPAEHTSGGQVEIVNKSALRPVSVTVLFTPEMEMRFNFSDDTRTRDEARMTNVLPVPDVELEVFDSRTQQQTTLARGSWVDMYDAWPAWGAFGHLNREITDDIVRTQLFAFGWSNFEQLWGNDPLVPPDLVNMLRARSVAEHYRKTYQIDPDYHSRIEAYRLYRVSILNDQTGAYAPAEIYSDWVRRPTYKGFARATSPNQQHGWHQLGYAADLSPYAPAPGRVLFADEEAGVFRLEPQIDPYGISNTMAWGYPEVSTEFPSQILSDANRTGLSLYANWGYLKLRSEFGIAMICTIVPGSPNDTRRLHAVTVYPTDLDFDPGESFGPPVVTRVLPGVRTARFAWSDTFRDEIYGYMKGSVDQLPEQLLINPNEVEEIAKATASRLYDVLRDRPQGSVSVDMQPKLEPAGTVDGVRHVMSNGQMLSLVGFQAVSEPLDIFRYLNASTRNVILRTLNNPSPRQP